jgi:hypothetical protein
MDLRLIVLQLRQLNIKSFVNRRLLWIQLRKKHLILCLLIFVPLFYSLNFLNCWLFLNCEPAQPTNIPPFLLTQKIPPLRKLNIGVVAKNDVLDDNFLVSFFVYFQI